MKQEIEHIDYEDLHFLFDMILKGEREMSLCYDSSLVLEVLLLRFCGAPRLESLVPLNPLILDKELKPDPPDVATPDTQDIKAPKEISQKKESQQNVFVKKNFLEFLKKTDVLKASLVEKVDIKEIHPQHFCFTIPDHFSYLKKRMTDSSFHKFLREQLTKFLNFQTQEEIDQVKIEFSYSNEALPVEEKKNKTEEQFLKQIQDNPFVNEVQKVFGGAIQSVIKVPK